MKNKFELGFVEKLVFTNYKIRSKAIQVNGEIDDNFKLVSKDNIFFFKIYQKNTNASNNKRERMQTKAISLRLF